MRVLGGLGLLLALALLGAIGFLAFSPMLHEVRESPAGWSALLRLATVNVFEARVPDYVLPDPLAGLRTPDQWTASRREEVLDHFRDQIYGASPALPAPGSPRVGPEAAVFGGRALRREVRIPLSKADPARTLDLLIHRPAEAVGPVPVFLALNFRGNQTIHPDPGIRRSERWVADGPAEAGFVDHRATEASRGARRSRWPVERIVARGYALATAYKGDLEPDHVDGFREGVRGILAEEAGIPADHWGAIAAWAWGLSRALDFLETDPAVDGRRVAVLGHSRLGKAALWAAAQDPRFAMAISNESGCMGAALSRRRFGETLWLMSRVFPHWFRPGFGAWAGREDALPVDQHMLLALVAPRPLYVASAADDVWSDPRGEFLAAREASRVWRFLVVEGLGATEPPPVGLPIPSRVGYHVRPGGHDLTAWDWERYLDFADRHL